MRVGPFELKEPLPELKEPHALVRLEPWVDVGSVGVLTLSWLETRFQAKELGKLARPGDFFDFTRYRPTSYFIEGRRQLTIPNVHITYAKRRRGKDFLFLHLLEPHSHGEIFVDSLLRLMGKLGVKRYCLIGSMYDYVPHTKPLLVSGGGVGKSVEQELKKLGIGSSAYQGPTSITTLIPQRASEIGIETMSLIVHLPQYTQLDEDYMGTLRLMEVLGSLYNLTIDEAYVKKAEKQLQQISMALDDDPRLKATIEQLENHYETQANRRKEEETPRLSPDVEKFLSEMERRFREN